MPITLFYHTGWERCLVHGCPKNNGGWTDLPFEDVPNQPEWKKLVLAADGLEFVVCDDKKSSWDKPPASYGKPNYLVEESGTFVLRHGQLRKLRKTRALVVTDLDHTLVGHERDPSNEILEEFRNLWLGEFALNGSALVYSTGRNKSSALEVAAERRLSRPQLLICGVGTEVYQVPQDLPLFGWWEAGDRLELIPSWKELMVTSFKRAETEALLVSKFPKFELRGSAEHDPYRIPTAYEVDADFEKNLQSLREAVAPGGQVISSGEGAWRLVDVCSSQAGKLMAMEFAIKTLSFRPEESLACGDSGNDELMYRCAGAKAVMVANAQYELIKALSATTKPPGTALNKGTVFETQEGCTVLFATREVAGGIVEALNRFFPS